MAVAFSPMTEDDTGTTKVANVAGGRDIAICEGADLVDRGAKGLADSAEAVRSVARPLGV